MEKYGKKESDSVFKEVKEPHKSSHEGKGWEVGWGGGRKEEKDSKARM